MKSEPGPPATLGSTAATGARIVVWCRACGHQVEPDPAAMAERYGADTTVHEWGKPCRGAGKERESEFPESGDRSRF